MRFNIRLNLLHLPLCATMAAWAIPVAHADVTVEERSSFDFTFIKAHGTSVEMTSAEKQRRSTDLHCEGFMSLFCRDAQSGEIIRLDKDVTWTLEPKKKQYRESRFPTAAERQAAERLAQETLEKMKQCPTPPATPTPTAAPDTSKCEMTPPRFDVKRTDQHSIFAGHDSQLTQLAMTQSCRNKETGDTCDFVMSLDTWLTQDSIAGVEDRKAFQAAYLHKLGLDDPNSLVQTQMRQFLAPYSQGMKDLAGKAGDIKGYPLKTSFRVLFGGEHCSAAQRSAQNGNGAGANPVGNAGQAAGEAATTSAAGAAGTEAGSAATRAAGNSVGGSIVGSAASAFGSKLVGGLFAKKKADQAASTPTSATPATPANMVQAVEFTVETTSIAASPIAASEFDIPAGWKLIPPEPAKAAREFSCPKPTA